MFQDKVTNYNVISTLHRVHSEPIMLISTISPQEYSNQMKYMHNPNSIEGFQVKTNSLAVILDVLYSWLTICEQLIIYITVQLGYLNITRNK